MAYKDTRDSSDYISLRKPCNSRQGIKSSHLHSLCDEGIQESSVAEEKNIISHIVTTIISEEEASDLNVRNIYLQREITHLLHQVSSMEKEINILNIHAGTFEVDLQGIILAVNDLMVEHSGFSREELVGKNTSIMNSGVHSREFWENFWTTTLSGKVWAGDICNKKKDGSLMWLWTRVIPKSDSTGDLIGFKVVRQDVSESYELKKKLEEALVKEIDFLTGLPNHTKCLEDFSIEKNRSIAILHINNMFAINSVFGRSSGDKIIKHIGEKLKTFALENNVEIYKFEGTDFIIVFKEGISEECIQDQYEKFNNFEIFDEHKHIHLSCSFGIALDEPNIVTLLEHGYLALNESKQTRKYVVFDTENHTTKESEDFFEMQNLVKEAFKKDLFEVFFQEIRENSCAIKKGVTRKFECLARMYDGMDKTKLISPGKFLPVIKKDGANQALTSCIIEKVCKFMSKNDGCYSINLTEEDLSAQSFAKRVYQKVSEYCINPNRIIFEVLEEIEKIESENVGENMRILKELGFEIAIDDFGTGYSNFSRMLNFEPNFIKIDISYVRGIDKNPRHKSLVRAIVGLAHDNGIMVVAEGVETENEQLVIENLGVDYSQGYLYSKPSPTI